MEILQNIGYTNAYLKAIENGGDRESLRSKLLAMDEDNTFIQKLVSSADKYFDTYGTQREAEQNALKLIRDNILVKASTETKDEAFWKTVATDAQAISKQLHEEQEKRTKAFGEFVNSVLLDTMEFVSSQEKEKERIPVNLREDTRNEKN